MDKEIFEGDLKGAIEQYKKLAESKDRSVAVKALMRMAECYQKLGDAESRRIYERVVREFGDHSEAGEARRKLGSAGESPATAVSSRRVWTAPPKADFYGKASPDGRYIPYTDWDQNGDLVVHDLATGTNRRLTATAGAKAGGSDEYAEEAAFSRDSKQVAYTWSLGNKGGVELRVVSLQGTGIPQPRGLVVNDEIKWISPYDWSPDGKSIAAHINRKDGTAQIALVSTQDGSIQTLKSVAWQGIAGVPLGIFFSPDGKYLAYDLPNDDPTGNHDVFILARDGSAEIPAASSSSQDVVTGWSPDGRRLLFASDRTGSWSLWAVAFGGGKTQGRPEFVRTALGPQTHGENLGLTSSGTQYSVVYDPGGTGPDVQVADFDFENGRFTSKPVPAAKAFLGTNMYPVWSPDGKYLAYASIRETHVAIGIRSAETGQIRDLVPSPNFPASAGYFWSLRWAPDGNSFVVAAQSNKDGNGIFRIDAQTGETSLIAKAARPRGAVVSSDHRSVYYRDEARDQDAAAIVKLDIATGERKELRRFKSRLNGNALNLSHDGRYIAVLGSDDPPGTPNTLVLIQTEAGEARQLISATGFSALNFSPDSKYISTTTADGASKTRVAWLFPIDGTGRKELMRVPDTAELAVAMWSPDSRSVLLRTSNADHSELWRVSIDTLKPQKLEAVVERAAAPLFVSPDGRHIAMQMPQSERKPPEIWVVENLLPAGTRR